jgi:hypothetical protein
VSYSTWPFCCGLLNSCDFSPCFRYRPSDLVIVATYCLQSMVSPLNELTDFDGRLGKLAKARLAAVHSFIEQAMT